MMMRVHFLGAASALRANALRSVLTMGGLAVGVAALIGLAGIGEGFQSAVSDEMAALGTHLLLVEPRSPAEDRRAVREPPRTLVAADARVIAAIPGIDRSVAVVEGSETALGPHGNSRIPLLGAEPGFAEALHLSARFGRLLSAMDEDTAEKSIVLGARIGRLLLGPDAGEQVEGGRAEISVGHALLRVIGILDPVGSFAGWDIDDSGFVPLSTARQRLFGTDPHSPLKVDALLLGLGDLTAKAAVSADIRAALRERHRIAPDDSSDFAVIDLAASARAETAILRTIRLFLLVMAAATILVGGVGIANIMLVAVAERKSEIGLLQAIGARRNDIMAQFLIEAALLALGGGLIGAALGLGCGSVAALGTGLSFHVAAWWVVSAVLGAGAIGILSGLLPALRASRLSPLAALRGPG